MKSQGNHKNTSNNLGFPFGWYALGLSKEFGKESLKTVPFMGSEVIVYRTYSGKLIVSDPYCPHLGAHFGYGGKVVGENLVCPFHAFEFNSNGNCIKTGYGTKPPTKAKVKIWTSKEVNGLVMVYFHPSDEVPTWEIPPLEQNEDWTPMIFKSFKLNDHPQEVTENSVDIGHFPVTHGYKEVTSLKQVFEKDHYLSTSYSFKKINPKPLNYLFGKSQLIKIETNIYGLGYSQVNVQIPKLKYQIRLWVLPTPINNEQLTLRLAMCLKKSKGLSGAFDNLKAKLILKGFAEDTQQDFSIWENKIFLPSPALAKGDGPIGTYRKWAKRFYE